MMEAQHKLFFRQMLLQETDSLGSETGNRLDCVILVVFIVAWTGRTYCMSEGRQRIDKWLWAARYYKTRSVATDAINKGQVTVNGQKPKPSRTIQPGDQLVITRDLQRFEITVLGTNDQRRPAIEARLLYEESSASIAAREELALKLRDERSVTRGLAGEGRPSKRQRRQIIRFQTSDPSSGEPD